MRRTISPRERLIFPARSLAVRRPSAAGCARALVLFAGAGLAAPRPAAADDGWQHLRWSVGLSQMIIDESGNQAAFRERADQYEGLALRALGFHVVAPHAVRIDFDAPRLDPVGHDARLEVGSRLLSGSLRSARNHFIFDPAGDLRSQRDQLTGDVRLRPVRHVELFTEYTRSDLSGRRQVLEAPEDGALGPSYDQDIETWRGGLRLDGLRSNLSLAYLDRSLASQAVPEFDRDVQGAEAQLRSQLLPAMGAEGVYGWSRTRLSQDGGQIESHRVQGRLDFAMGKGFTAGPTGRYEDTSDRDILVRSQIWALGLAVRGAFPRGWCDLEGEAGQRETSAGLAKVRGLRASAGSSIGAGFSVRGLYQRRARHRQDIDLPAAGQPPLPNRIGTLMAQRVEGRLRWRVATRWTAEGLVARFDKDYDDVRVEQQVWRYGLQGSYAPGARTRCDVGWRLDDVAESRPASRYDLRTHILYGGLETAAWSRLVLRGRADFYRMQRALDEWKLLVTAGAELDVGHDLFLGLAYERDRFDAAFDTGDYRANVWEFTLRHTFGM